MTNKTEISKYIALILRHKPETIGIKLDEHGWANVEELIKGINVQYYSDDGSMSCVGSFGYYWSASPYSENYGYYLYFYSGYVNPADNYNRASGFSVRCVQE